MSANKDALNRIYDAFRTGKIDLLDQVVDENAIDHRPDPLVNADPNRGRDYLKATIRTYRGAFPDLKLDVLCMVEENDMVISYFTCTGTNTGNLGETPPTGKRVKVDVCDVVKFRNGKMVEHWGMYDALGMMMQLGLLPENVLVSGGVAAEVFRRR